MKIRIFDNGKIVNATYVKANFEIDFHKSVHTDKDAFGNDYTKTCHFMMNQIRLSFELIDWLTNGCHANVRKVLHYIIHHLKYGKNYLTICNKDICSEEPNIDVAAVSNALKVLKEKNI